MQNSWKTNCKHTSKGERQSVGPICHQLFPIIQKSNRDVHQYRTCTYVPTARSRPCLSHWWLLQVGVVILAINLRPKKNQLPFCVCFSYSGLSPQDALGDAKASILWCSGLAIWMNAVINCVMLKKNTSTVNSLQAHFSTGIMGGGRVSSHNSIKIDVTKPWNFYTANDSFETIEWIYRIHHPYWKKNWADQYYVALFLCLLQL